MWPIFSQSMCHEVGRHFNEGVETTKSKAKEKVVPSTSSTEKNLMRRQQNNDRNGNNDDFRVVLDTPHHYVVSRALPAGFENIGFRFKVLPTAFADPENFRGHTRDKKE